MRDMRRKRRYSRIDDRIVKPKKSHTSINHIRSVVGSHKIKRIDAVKPIEFKPYRKLYSVNYVKFKKNKTKCKEEIKRDDKARRHAFFKARHKGSAVSRPAHNRKHKRSC